MDSATTTLHIDANGRMYLPKAVRQSLDIEGRKATLEVEIEVLERE